LVEKFPTVLEKCHKTSGGFFLTHTVEFNKTKYIVIICKVKYDVKLNLKLQKLVV